MADESIFNNTGMLVFLGGVLVGAAAIAYLGNANKTAPTTVVAAPKAEEIVITDAKDGE